MYYLEYKAELVEKMVNYLIKNKKEDKFVKREINNTVYYAFSEKFVTTNIKYFLPLNERFINICYICGIRAIHNYKKYDYGMYCVKHRLENMDNVIVRKQCKQKNCKTYPIFGYEWKNRLYCVSHKKEDMINVSHKMCAFEGCKTRPSYNIEGNGPLYCLEHKQENMVDVISKKCKFEGCKKQCSFGFESKGIWLRTLCGIFGYTKPSTGGSSRNFHVW